MVLIFTVVDNLCNFGQRLQAYGLQQAFAKIGQKAYIVDKRISNTEPEAFSCFEHEYLNYVKYCVEELPKLDISLVVLGSDWTLACNNDDLRFGSLAIKYSQLVASFPYTMSYASSCGNTLNAVLSRGKYGKYLKFIQPLKSFKSISVREDGLLKNAIKSVVGKDVEVCKHVDPVFLLSADEWRRIAKRPTFIAQNEVFDLSYGMFGKKQLNVIVQADGSKLVQCYGNLDMSNECTRQSVVMSPQNFLWLVMNCRHFTTSSFHGAAFGILFKKSMKICNIADSRISNIINMLDVKCSTDGVVIDYNKAYERIDEQRRLSYEYLKANADDANKLYNSCSFTPHTFCCFQKAKALRDKSASGGFCAAIAKHILQKPDSIVYGAAYANDFKTVKYMAVSTVEDFYKQLAKSKYFMPALPKLSVVKDQLDAGLKVLFIGCPCHINALKRHLKAPYGNLTTVSLVCHGVCSCSKYQRTIDEYSCNNGSKLVDVDMRTSHECSTLFTYADDSTKKMSNQVLLERSSICEQCKVSNDPRKQMSDFFVGDFWDYKCMKHIDCKFDPKEGVNKVVVLTQHGYEMWKQLQQELDFKEI